ncbi:hypothetical protein PENSPDRAFT_736222 [Peniophora sp. CONT]|nr:hypothetical protein PENSPDRAFT_736222 [Peniophora sp. CONT]
MAPSALQARIAAFEALQNGDSSLLEPSSPTTSDSKDSEWVLEPPQPSPTIKIPRTSPPKKRPSPSSPIPPQSTPAPPLPPRQATLELPNLGHKRGQSSVSSMHSVSLSSDQGDDEQHVQTYPLDTDNTSLSESFEDVTVPASYREHAPISYSQRRVPPPPSPIPVPLPPPLPQRQSSTPAIPAQRASPNTTGSSTGSGSRRVPPPPPPPQTGPLPYVARTRTPSMSRPPSVRSFASGSSAPPVPTRTASVSSTSTSNNHTTPRISPALTVQGTGNSSIVGASRGRAPPMPPAARTRYDKVFDANWRVNTARPSKKAKKDGNGMLSVPGTETPRTRKGWRGLSVDLIPADNPAFTGESEKSGMRVKVPEREEIVPGDARLSSGVVKRIWSLSRLDRARLKDIWDSVAEPATPGAARQSGLTREAFARGMWTIDDDLRRARIGALAGKRRQPTR